MLAADYRRIEPDSNLTDIGYLFLRQHKIIKNIGARPDLVYHSRLCHLDTGGGRTSADILNFYSCMFQQQGSFRHHVSFFLGSQQIVFRWLAGQNQTFKRKYACQV